MYECVILFGIHDNIKTDSAFFLVQFTSCKTIPAQVQKGKIVSQTLIFLEGLLDNWVLTPSQPRRSYQGDMCRKQLLSRYEIEEYDAVINCSCPTCSARWQRYKLIFAD